MLLRLESWQHLEVPTSQEGLLGEFTLLSTILSLEVKEKGGWCFFSPRLRKVSEESDERIIHSYRSLKGEAPT